MKTVLEQAAESPDVTEVEELTEAINWVAQRVDIPRSVKGVREEVHNEKFASALAEMKTVRRRVVGGQYPEASAAAKRALSHLE